MKSLFLGKMIKEQENGFVKSILQTTNVLLWVVVLATLGFLANLLLKISTYGFDIGLKSTINTFEMLLSPLFSPLFWTSSPRTTLYYFIINLFVFYLMFGFSFGVRNVLLRAFCLVLVTIIMIGWYFVYILSNASI
ncbi:hypothetical protein [Mesobacillus maritimus]|uniref:hypothetical protein n=1 Tax=Mesobacillus maritimus TaxID=1643336 RepID=UPI00384BF448